MKFDAKVQKTTARSAQLTCLMCSCSASVIPELPLELVGDRAVAVRTDHPDFNLKRTYSVTSGRSSLFSRKLTHVGKGGRERTFTTLV